MSSLALNGAPAKLHTPDALINEAFQNAMHNHVLRFPNPDVAPWYWGIQSNRGGCYCRWGTLWPGLDDHQAGHALLWAGHVHEHFGYWDYVKATQHLNGQIAFRVETDDTRIPKDRMSDIYISFLGRGQFVNWIPGPSLFVLGSSTWIKHGYDLFRFTQDVD